MPAQHTRKIVRVGGFCGFRSRIFSLRAITPADFLGDEHGFPIGFFANAVRKTMHDRVMEATGGVSGTKTDHKRQLEAMKFVLRHGVVSVNKRHFDVEDYFNAPGGKIGEALFLFDAILGLTFKKFRKMQDVDNANAIAIDAIAKRYGKTPIEVIMPFGGYSDMDAWMFNMFVASRGIEEHNRQMEAAMRKHK